MVPVCVCALFMGHIGYISLKTKNIIFFFIIKVFAKTRNYKKKKKKKPTRKKKKSVSAVHSKAEMPVFCFSASCRLLAPSRLVLWATSGEAVSRRFILDLQPEGSRQLIYNRSFLHIWLWGQGPSRDPTYQQKQGHTSSSVPSLKT